MKKKIQTIFAFKICKILKTALRLKETIRNGFIHRKFSFDKKQCRINNKIMQTYGNTNTAGKVLLYRAAVNSWGMKWNVLFNQYTPLLKMEFDSSQIRDKR